MQELQVWPLTQEDLTCHGAAKPIPQNYWASALEPGNLNYWAHMLQLPSLLALEPVPCNEKPLRWEATTAPSKWPPLAATGEKPMQQ